MMTKRILIYIFFLIESSISLAQEKKSPISFSYYTHDFGSIKEDGGLVSYDFNFTNISTTPFSIKNVQAACGCTIPEWSTASILPGANGIVKVEFNPFNKPGPFNKSLIVHLDKINESIILNVTGKVIPKPKKPSDDFPDLIGSLRMVSRYMNLGEITTEKIISKDFTIYNQADSAITIYSVNFPSQFSNVQIENYTIPSKSKTTISIQYDPSKKNDYGYLQDKIELLSNDKILPKKSIYITSTIRKYFPAYSAEELSLKAKIQLNRMNHDFGSIIQGEKVTTIFEITNIGKEPLQIYKVKPSCGCTITNLDQKLILSGETGKLTITFDTNGKEGVQEKHINLYTNDPLNFNPVLTLKAKINKPTQ